MVSGLKKSTWFCSKLISVGYFFPFFSMQHLMELYWQSRWCKRWQTVQALDVYSSSLLCFDVFIGLLKYDSLSAVMHETQRRHSWNKTQTEKKKHSTWSPFTYIHCFTCMFKYCTKKKSTKKNISDDYEVSNITNGLYTWRGNTCWNCTSFQPYGTKEMEKDAHSL